MPPPTITANDLRRLAEAADNCENNVSHAVVFDADENTFKVVRTDAVDGRAIALTINNSEALPATARRQSTTDVTLRVHVEAPAADVQIPLRSLPNNTLPDCAFWGPTAMRKFMLPYYIRSMRAADLDVLRSAIDDPDVVALTHTCPSDYSIVGVPGGDLTVHLGRLARSGEAEFIEGGPGVNVSRTVSFPDWAAGQR